MRLDIDWKFGREGWFDAEERKYGFVGETGLFLMTGWKNLTEVLGSLAEAHTHCGYDCGDNEVKTILRNPERPRGLAVNLKQLRNYPPGKIINLVELTLSDDGGAWAEWLGWDTASSVMNYGRTVTGKMPFKLVSRHRLVKPQDHPKWVPEPSSEKGHPRHENAETDPAKF